MAISRLELLLLNLKLLTVVGAGVLSFLALRSSRRVKGRSLKLLTAGLGSIGVGAAIAFFGGFILGPTPSLWLLESTLVLIGVVLLLCAIFVE